MSNSNLDELLKILEEAEKKQKASPISKFSSKNKPHVKRFIDDLQIQTGVERVSTLVIFHAYINKWDGITREKKLKKIEFFRQFKKYFTSIRTGKQRYYLLSPESFDLSREGLLEADHYNKYYNKVKRTRSELKEKKRALGQSKT